MSFLQQLDGEAPALTLEETLAFLDAFEYGSDDTTSSSSSSPPFEDTLSLDDEFSADSTATTAGSGSERSCSDADDYYLSTLLSLPLDSVDAAPVTPQTTATTTAGAAALPPPTPPVKPQPQRTKRKATTSASSPKNASTTTMVGGTPKPSTAGNGTKRRARKMPKTEILRLRDEVEELQARLTQLQKATSGSGASVRSSNSASTAVARTSGSTAMTARTSSSWLDSAVEQFKALQKSQSLNEKLKTEVSRQARLGNALKSIFAKKTAQQGMEFVMEMEPAKSATPKVLNPCDRGAWMPFGSRSANGHAADSEAETLYKSVESMQIETDNVQRAIAAESDRDAVFSSSKTKVDHEFGPVFELKTNTPVKHPNFHEVALMFWNRAIQSQHSADVAPDDTSTPLVGVVASQTVERPITLRIQSASGEVVLNGVSVMCRQDELERSAFTFAATLAVAGDTPLVFREHGWMIIAPHATDASQSVLQTFYRLDSEKRRMKQAAGSAAATPDMPFSSELTPHETMLRDIGIRALSENMRSFQSEVQSALMNQGAGFDTAKLPRTCPLHNIKALLQG